MSAFNERVEESEIIELEHKAGISSTDLLALRDWNLKKADKNKKSFERYFWEDSYLSLLSDLLYGAHMKRARALDKKINQQN